MRWIRRLRLRLLYWLLEPLGEFVAWTREELDFRIEARYLERLRRNASGNPRERVPEVSWELSSERILVLAYLDGPPVLDYIRALEVGDELTVRRLKASGFEPEGFARAVIENFLSDAFLHGVFHADLHPANLLVLPQNVVGYVDFGITGVLSVYSRRHLVSMTLAYSRGDLDGMCEAFFKVSTFEPGRDPAEFRRCLGRVAETWYEVRGRRRTLSKSFTQVMLEMLRVSRATGVWPERDVVKYIRSAIAIDGLIERFAPGFDVGGHIETVCDRHLRGEGWRRLATRRRLFEAIDAGSRVLERGPQDVMAVLDRFLEPRPPAPPPVLAPEPPRAVALGLAALACAGGAYLSGGAEPAAGFNLFTVQAGLALASLSLLLLDVLRGEGPAASGKESLHA